MRHTFTAVALVGLVSGLFAVPSVAAADGHYIAAPAVEAWRAHADPQRHTADDVVVNPRGHIVYVAMHLSDVVDGWQNTRDMAVVAYDAFTGEHLWEASYDGSLFEERDSDTIRDIAVSPDGETLYMGGTTVVGLLCDDCGNTDTDYVTVAVDADTGERLWVATWGNGMESAQTHRTDTLGDVVVSPDSSAVYVTGAAGGGHDLNHTDVVTVAYDAKTGDELWVSRYDGPMGRSDIPIRMDVGLDGQRLVIGGRTPRDNNTHLRDYQTMVLGLDTATGELVWERFHKAELWSNTSDVGVSPDGKTAYVSTGAYTQVTSTDYLLLAYDVETGEEVWKGQYAYSGIHLVDSPSDLAVSPTGDAIYVTGFVEAAQKYTTGRDYQTVAFDSATGEVLWAERFNGSLNIAEEARSVEVSPDGLWVYITGDAADNVYGRSYRTLAYNAQTGALVWDGRYGEGHDRAGRDLAVHPDGSRVYVIGKDTPHDTTIAYCAQPLGGLGECLPGQGSLLP